MNDMYFSPSVSHAAALRITRILDTGVMSRLAAMAAEARYVLGSSCCVWFAYTSK